MMFPEAALRQAEKDLRSLEDEFSELSDRGLRAELERLDRLAADAVNSAGRARSEMMRRALKRRYEKEGSRG